jgi:hypothetical protein
MFQCILLNLLNILIINSFNVNTYDNAIGKWQLLYSNNKFLTDNKFKLDISPCKNKKI